MTDAVWRIYGPDEPIRCPARLPGGRLCDRAQDMTGPGTFVRVRPQPDPKRAIPSSLLRICRSCDAKLEVNVCVVTELKPVPV